MKTKITKHYSPEVRERAVRMISEHQGEYASEWAAIQSISAKIGCTAETLRRWLRESQKATGGAKELGGGEPERIKALEREVRELRQANEILRKASAYFAQAELDYPEGTSAGSSHEGVYRRLPLSLRGRADLQGLADCPVDILPACGKAC